MGVPSPPETPRSDRSVQHRFPRATTLAVFVGCFAASFGVLYATLVSAYEYPFLAIPLAATWLLSIVVLTLLAQPFSHRLKTGTRAIPGALRTDVERSCERAGVPLRGAWLSVNPPGHRPATIAGIVAVDRHFIVDEWFFATLSSPERASLAAREAALVHSNYLLYTQVVVPFIALVSGLALIAVGVVAPLADVVSANGIVAFALGASVVFLFALRHGRRKIYAADRFAAQQTSPSVVVSLLEKQVRHIGGPTAHWTASLVRLCPSTNRRIGRLRTLEVDSA